MPAFGQEILLHEESDGFPVTGGVTYEEKTLFTSLGWQKIHILKVDLTSDNVDIDTLIGKEGLSNRSSLSRMVQDSGAVAAINGDFFIPATPSAPIGPQVQNGKLLSSSLNMDDMSSIGISFDKIPQIFNMRFSGSVIAPNGNEFTVEGVNKIRNSYNNVFIYTPEFGSVTPKPGEGAPDLIFLTVKDNHVVNITEGKTCNIPDDGLVLMAWGDGGNFLKTFFTIGDQVKLNFQTVPDISNLKMVLGGGAILVDNGTIPESFTHNITGTHPRTAVGFTADKKAMIMVVVDGRQAQSRGMSQQEMAQLMLSLGAHNALNLDGGGSSTMVVRPFGYAQTKVINSVSEGTQRLIPNGIGIFSTKTVGDVHGIKIEAPLFNIAKGGHRTFQVKAYDKNYNLVDIDQSQVKWSVSNDLGYFNGNVFTANNSGIGEVTASYGKFKASQEIRILKDNVMLSIEPGRIHINPGAKSVFQVFATDSQGFKALLDPIDITWEIKGDIGTINKNEFVANKSGSGAIIANFSGLKTGALVLVGYNKVLVDEFENYEGKSFRAYPDYVKGSFNITSLPDPVYSGNYAGKISYDFSEGTVTRAAYLAFANKTLPAGTNKLGLWIYGQNQGEWLRASIQDASGKESVVDFTKSINWDGWRWVEVNLPSGKQPFILNTIYVVETDPARKLVGTIYIDELTAMFTGKYDESLLPPVPMLIDEANQQGSGFTFGAVGTIPLTKDNRPDYEKTLNIGESVLNTYNSSFNVFVGQPWADENLLKDQLANFKDYMFSGKGYSTSFDKEANFIFLDATKGSIRTTDYTQWLNLKNDLYKLDKSKPLFIVIDRAPEAFSDPLEGELLKKLLTEHANSSAGVWVLSGSNSHAFSSQVKDGVHYISIPGINSKEPAVAIFNVSGDKVNYQVIPLIESITSETTGVKSGIATNLKVYGITPTNQKILLGYPYAGEWKVSYDKPVGFDPKTLTFKAIDPGTASIEVKIGEISTSFSVQISDISVLVNGVEVSFPDQVPYINKDNRTMVPVRFISESLGAKVSWDNDNRMVIIEKENTIIKLKIGENKADVNGETITFDTSAVIQNSRTMVPIRFISEALGANVGWNQTTKTVIIDS